MGFVFVFRPGAACGTWADERLHVSVCVSTGSIKPASAAAGVWTGELFWGLLEGHLVNNRRLRVCVEGFLCVCRLKTRHVFAWISHDRARGPVCVRVCVCVALINAYISSPLFLFSLQQFDAEEPLLACDTLPLTSWMRECVCPPVCEGGCTYARACVRD